MGTKIIIDSNIFIEGSITTTPSLVTSIASMAKHLSAQVFLTEGSLEEIIQKNLERFDRNVENIKKAVQGYENEICVALQVSMIEKEKFIEAFETKFNSYLGSNQIGVLKLPSSLPGHSEFFKLAVQKQAPFNSAGNNFRDAIIGLSTVEVCKAFPNDEFLFVTKDKEFINLMKKLKVPNLSVHDDLQIQEELESRLSVETIKYIEQKKEEIKKIANGEQLSELRQYCIEHGQFDIQKFRFISDDIVAIKGLKNLEVEAVENIELAEDPDKPFRFSLRLVGEIELDVETSKAKKEAFMQTLSSMAGLSSLGRKPSKVGDVRTNVKTNTWEELHRQQAGYYDKFVESRPTLVFLRVKSEVEIDKITGHLRLQFLAVNHIERSYAMSE